jgi:hypothetical protein
MGSEVEQANVRRYTIADPCVGTNAWIRARRPARGLCKCVLARKRRSGAAICVVSFVLTRGEKEEGWDDCIQMY